MQKVNDWCNEVSDWKALGSDIYIAAQIPANSVNPYMVFEVGDGKTYDGYENKQLSNGQKYKIYSRGLARRALRPLFSEDFWKARKKNKIFSRKPA